MTPSTASIAHRPRGGAALLNSVSRTALAAPTMGLALGVRPAERGAGAVRVNPVQSVTYDLSSACNPITFGPATNISPPGPSANGVYGDSSMPWNVTNNGSIQGVAQGSGYYAGGSLASSGSIVTNTGTILGTGQHSIGVALSGVSIVKNNAGTDQRRLHRRLRRRCGHG